MKTENKVSIPRWHYRDVQMDAQDILKGASNGVGIRGAMINYLTERKNALPDGTTPASAVDAILRTVDGFAVAKNEAKSVEDVKNALRDAVSGMETSQALRYLATLDCMFSVCDAQVNGDGKVPSADEIKEQIRAAVAGAGEADVATRIDALAEKVMGNSLKAYVYATGLNELKELAATPEDGDSGMSQETAERIHAAICADVDKIDVYAATACACYGRILDGKVPGVPKENIDAGIMTALVVAGMEKASILVRLARGEIDAELAKEMLDALWRTFKWVLITLVQAVMIIAVADFTMWAIPSALLWLMTTAYVLPVIGLIIGVVVAVECHDDIKGAINWLCGVVGALARLVGKGVVWVKDVVAGNTAPVPNPAPAAC